MKTKHKKTILIPFLAIILLTVPIEIAYAAPQQQFTMSFVTFSVKIALIVGAAFVPVTLGDKLTQGISRSIGNLTKNTKRSAWKKSGVGAALEQRRKYRESSAFETAAEKSARPSKIANRIRNKFEGLKKSDSRIDRAIGSLGSRIGYSDDQRARLKTEAIGDYAKQFEGTDKMVPYNYLQRYARETGQDTEGNPIWELHDKEGFKNDYKAQGALLSVLKADLANDDNIGRFRYIDDMIGEKIGEGDANFIPTAKKSGAGYFWDRQALRGNANKAVNIGATAFRVDAESFSNQNSGSLSKAAHFYENLASGPQETFEYNDDYGQKQTMTSYQAADRMVDKFVQHNSIGQLDHFFQSMGGNVNMPKMIGNLRSILPQRDAGGNITGFKNDFARAIYTEHSGKGREWMEGLEKNISDWDKKGIAARPVFTRP